MKDNQTNKDENVQDVEKVTEIAQKLTSEQQIELYHSLPRRAYSDYESKPLSIAVLGEGPVGLASVYTMLDEVSRMPMAIQDQFHITFVGSHFGEPYGRRHLVTVDDEFDSYMQQKLNINFPKNKQGLISIRTIEALMFQRIAQHPLFERCVKMENSFKQLPQYDVTFVAQGYRSETRNEVFFGGDRTNPLVLTTARSLILYLNIPSVEVQPNTQEEYEKNLNVKKMIFSEDQLRSFGVEQPDVLIDGIKLLYDCPTDSKTKDNFWVSGFDDQASFSQNMTRKLEDFKKYIHNFNNKIPDKVNKGDFSKPPYYANFDIDAALKKQLSNSPNDFIQKLEQNLKQLDNNFPKMTNNMHNSPMLVVAILPKIANFGLNGYVAENPNGGAVFLVGDAGIAYPAGSTGLTSGMTSASRLAKLMSVTTTQYNKISSDQMLGILHPSNEKLDPKIDRTIQKYAAATSQTTQYKNVMAPKEVPTIPACLYDLAHAYTTSQQMRFLLEVQKHQKSTPKYSK